MSSLCQDDFSPYEHPLEHIYENINLHSILKLNTALKTPFITDNTKIS